VLYDALACCCCCGCCMYSYCETQPYLCVKQLVLEHVVVWPSYVTTSAVVLKHSLSLQCVVY
jgi:hypothetical protein